MKNDSADIGTWLERGFDLYRTNLEMLVPACAIAVVLGACTLGVLSGPMLAGLLAITLGLYDRNAIKPKPGDIFTGFDRFVPAFLFLLAWVMIPLGVLMWVPRIGWLLCLAWTFLVMPLGSFGLFLILERGMDFWTASMESIETARRRYMTVAAVHAVAAILGSLGFVACGIGVVITMPLYCCVMAVSYRDVFREPAAPFPADA